MRSIALEINDTSNIYTTKYCFISEPVTPSAFLLGMISLEIHTKEVTSNRRRHYLEKVHIQPHSPVCCKYDPWWIP